MIQHNVKLIKWHPAIHTQTQTHERTGHTHMLNVVLNFCDATKLFAEIHSLYVQAEQRTQATVKQFVFFCIPRALATEPNFISTYLTRERRTRSFGNGLVEVVGLEYRTYHPPTQ